MKKRFLKISIATISLLIGLTLGVNAQNSDICESPTDLISRGGVSIRESGPTPRCPEGTNFPTFNVFNDAQIFPSGRHPEFDFALVRIEEEGSDGAMQGYSNNVYLAEGNTAKQWNFIHNGGKPGRNSTIARNVFLKINGFERDENGDYIKQPDRISGDRAIYNIDVSITSSNTTPRTITDSLTIQTDSDKLLRLINDDPDLNGRFKKCTTLSECEPVTTILFAAHRAVSGSGFPLEIRPSGGDSNAVYASERYRGSLAVYFEAVDAPVEPVCEYLNITQLNDPVNEGDAVRFDIEVEPEEDFLANVRTSIGGFDSTATLSNGNRRVTARNWENDDILTVFVQTSDVLQCRKEVVLFAEPPICEELDFTRINNPSEEGERVRYELREVTDGFRNDISFSRSDGRVDTGRFAIDETVSFTDWEEGDKFVAHVPGQDACVYEDTPSVPGCSDLVLTPNFDEDDLEFIGQEVSFRVDVSPRSFFDAIEHDLDGRSENVSTRNIGRTIDVVGWSEGSTVTSQVPGEASCLDTYTFPEIETEEPICRSLEFDIDNIVRDGETAIIPTEIIVDEDFGDFEVDVTADNGAGVAFNAEDSSLIVTGIGESTTVTASIEDYEACRDEYTFTTTEDECELLTLEVIDEDDDRFTFEATVTPSDFDIVATVSGGADVVNQESEEGILRFDVINFDEDTEVRVEAQGTDVVACSKEFDDFPEEEEEPLCRDLDVTPSSYDHTVDTVERFRATTTPDDLDAPFIWEIYELDEDGDRELVTGPVEDNGTYTVRDLDGRQIIRVYIEDEFVEEEYSCEAEIEGEVPFNQCPDLQIRRPDRPSYESAAYCPERGQPIILQPVGYDDFEDEVVWRAEGECNELNGPIFTDGEQEARCELVTDIENPVIIRGCNESSFITVESVSQPEQCNAVIPPGPGEGDKPGELFKEVVHSSFVSRDVSRVTYRVTYKPNFAFFSNIFDEVTLFDNIGATLLGQNPEFPALGILPGTLSPIPESMVVTDPTRGQLDVDGNIFSPDGVTISNLDELAVGDSVSIQYDAQLNSALKFTDACERLVNSCGETFINTATDNFSQESSASLTALCPFILARGFGDVFLEQDFSAGIDIAKCTSRPSAEGPVFTPAPEQELEIVQTGSQDLGPSHRVCKEGGVEGYGDEVLGSISSSVCEVGLTLAERWQTESITNGIEVNILRIARNLIPLASSTISDLSEANLSNLNPNPGSQVIIRDNADLEIGTAGETLVVDGKAKTIIVRNGNLRINSNIEYGAATDPTKPPVIAFLVINGNIEIAPGVTDLAGIYAAVAKDEGTGFIQRSSQSDQLLTIRGSVFGDLEPLFNQTTAVGDLVRDRGAVTVIYDGRIVLNTPPGLEDIVEFNQYQTANGNVIFN